MEAFSIAKGKDNERTDVDEDSPCSSGMTQASHIRDLQPIITSAESTMCIPVGEGLNNLATFQSSVSTNSLVECPTCSLSFPIAEIADHADLCCDVWVGDVFEEIEEEVGESLKVEETVPVVKETVSIKEVVHALINNMSNRKPRRVNIRRKLVWSDFKEARQKGVIGVDDHIKVVFIANQPLMMEDQGGSFSQVC